MRHLGEGRHGGPLAVAADLGAVARHQLQEITLHTNDAQITLGDLFDPQPLPDEAALDGVDAFLSTCCATTPLGRKSPPGVCRLRPVRPHPLDSLRLDGDHGRFELLRAWDPVYPNGVAAVHTVRSATATGTSVAFGEALAA